MTAHGPPSVMASISAKPLRVDSSSPTSSTAARTVAPLAEAASCIFCAFSSVRTVPMTS